MPRSGYRRAFTMGCGSTPDSAGGRRTGPCARGSGSGPPAPGTAGARPARAPARPTAARCRVAHAADERATRLSRRRPGHAGDRAGGAAQALVRQRQRSLRVEPLQELAALARLQPPVRAPPPQQLAHRARQLHPAQARTVPHDLADQRQRKRAAPFTMTGFGVHRIGCSTSPDSMFSFGRIRRSRSPGLRMLFCTEFVGKNGGAWTMRMLTRTSRQTSRDAPVPPSLDIDRQVR